jgi:putative ABC transport system substrate-binding protein
MPVLGVLSAEWPDLFTERLRAFRDGLKEAGYVEGRNLAIEYRWAEGRNDRLPELAADLVRRHVTMIVAAGTTPGALAAKAATNTIPIVFYVGADPIEVGLVTSLSRPGGNVTGVVTLNVSPPPPSGSDSGPGNAQDHQGARLDVAPKLIVGRGDRMNTQFAGPSAHNPPCCCH